MLSVYWICRCKRETAGQIAGTVQDSSVLADKRPTLTVPCEFAYAEVTFNGTKVECTLADGNISFTVAAAGGAEMVTVTLPAQPGTPTKFKDVDAGIWYREAVDAVTGLGLIKGSGANSFDPDGTATRGMVVTVLHRLSGEADYGVGAGNFNDVKDGAWYADAADWAKAVGVTKGSGSGAGFKPETAITREQLATMLYRYARAIGAAKPEGADLSRWTDGGQVSGYAREAMEWAVSASLIQGRGSSLAPQGTATRAELAAVLARFVETLKK